MRGISALAVRLGDVPLRNGVPIVLAIFLVLAMSPLRRGFDAVGRALPVSTVAAAARRGP